MANKIEIRNFSKQKQMAGACVLFSYWRILEHSNPGYKFHAFCREYLKLMLSEYLTKGVEYPMSQLRALKNCLLNLGKDNISNRRFKGEKDLDPKDVQKLLTHATLTPEVIRGIKTTYLFEYVAASVLHHYCQCVENDMRGYEHIQWLHEKIRTTKGLQIPVQSYDVQFAEKGDIDKADVLSKLGREYAFVMILFTTPNGWHSVVLTKSEDEVYIIDPIRKKPQQWSEYAICDIKPMFRMDDSWENYVTECLTFSPFIQKFENSNVL